MSDQNKKPSIFQKVLDTANAVLDAQLIKAKEGSRAQAEADFNMGKAITRDRNQYFGSLGYQERPGAIGYEFQRHMAIKSSIVAAIIRTRQNQVAAFSKPSMDDEQKGFRIVLKDKEYALEQIKEELFGKKEEPKTSSKIERNQTIEDQLDDSSGDIKKAEEINPASLEDVFSDMQEAPSSEREKTRVAKEELEKRILKKKKAIQQFLEHCGELHDRPFESKRWKFDSFLRAIVYDSLVYDQMAVEFVPKEAATVNGRFNLHHFLPVDGSTIRYSSPELQKYKDSEINLSQDILYPEEELKAVEERDTLELDDDRLENNEYKYVQIIKGRIQRAFTEDELSIGIRNPVTDIYSNWYGLPELEILVSLVSSHLQTEYYNKSYFQQGFSAKGILHVKANLNRSKLEELRRHWTHMVKGNRNSFQTPIMSGMEEIQWIPLTQNHNEMEFNLWLNYLIKMICSIYQIDPSEIGYGMKDEGGAGMSGDNTAEKLGQSKGKGFVPLMRFVSEFVNRNIIDKLDPDYCLEWVGLEDESSEDRIKRQSQEVKYKKTVNEIRGESGLPTIEGADDLVLDPVYFQWYSQFHPDAIKINQQNMEQQQSMMGGGMPGDQDNQEMQDLAEDQQEADQQEDVEKSLKIEYYTLEK